MRRVIFFLGAILIVSRVISVASAQVAPSAASTATSQSASSEATNGVTDAVNQLVSKLSAAALPFLGAMAAIGALSMAIIQAVKNMFPVLRIFQRNSVQHWLAQNAHKVTKPPQMALADVSEQKAEQDLVALATAGDANAFFNLPIEKLCGQMNAAAQIVLQYPEEHPDLLCCLASLASATDLGLLMNRELRQDLDAKMQRARAAAPGSTDLLGQEDRTAIQDMTDARTRVTSIIQRSIDGLQISVGSRWKFGIQVTAFILSALIVLLAALASPESFGRRYDPLLLIVTTIAAGFLAPVARDLVASIEQLRNG